MISKKILISLLFISLIISINCVNAVDNSDWKTVKVNNVDFKVPPKYQGGELSNSDNCYMITNIFTFGIRCVDDYLDSSYGDDYNFKAKNSTIGTHDVSYITEYVNVIKHNVSYVYFSSGDSIYCISWNGQMNEEIEEMIINTPDSSYDADTFYGILDEARHKYDDDQAAEKQSIEYEDILRANNKHHHYYYSYPYWYRM
ncbi:hypothetical protein [uncultured Methanobrevibacter sp.]|uniref:hypothetical protein n=1 Tax=uncultured Methanobrevibacter sp. TaxID=253161 RepID=UPI0026030112|nr:hypothetical protein [uncultured Methanobrevibacter sp.]